MSTSSGTKRKGVAKKMADNATTSNLLFDNCHDYFINGGGVKLHLMNEEVFPSLPVTPEKPPTKKERITEMERYSRRWNLRLHGVAKRVEDRDVREEVIRVCQALLPSDAERLPNVIDTVHRVGVKKPKGNRTFSRSWTCYLHAIWK
ncbi:uncharacterized protein [Nerophis lumbriciformis]|uniref:uncharacterized protein n=1 Tax=Nerophis lumbriciformis TaxID=546530 RepID=UPI002ADF1941|nr:uncharacterized protein si:ch211-196c10.15 [Nerophis lumbriciformis]